MVSTPLPSFTKTTPGELQVRPSPSKKRIAHRVGLNELIQRHTYICLMKEKGGDWFLPFVGVLLLLAAPSFISLPIDSLISETSSLEQECNLTATSTLQNEPCLKLIRESSNLSFNSLSWPADVENTTPFKHFAYSQRHQIFLSLAFNYVQSSIYLNYCNLRL